MLLLKDAQKVMKDITYENIKTSILRYLLILSWLYVFEETKTVPMNYQVIVTKSVVPSGGCCCLHTSNQW